MPNRILLTLAIIVGVGLGTGLVTFGVLQVIFESMERETTLIAGGSTILAASVAALIAQFGGAFRGLDSEER